MTNKPTMQLSIAEKFSRMPAGRYRADGPYNAVDFRSNLLIPSLLEAAENNGILVVELDGVLGYSSSFLEEAFGGLLRDPRVTPDMVRTHLILSAKSRAYEAAKLDIEQYISDAITRFGAATINDARNVAAAEIAAQPVNSNGKPH
jgi:STAS-like domain of unknown function (DUF4325)